MLFEFTTCAVALLLGKSSKTFLEKTAHSVLLLTLKGEAAHYGFESTE